MFNEMPLASLQRYKLFVAERFVEGAAQEPAGTVFFENGGGVHDADVDGAQRMAGGIAEVNVEFGAGAEAVLQEQSETALRAVADFAGPADVAGVSGWPARADQVARQAHESAAFDGWGRDGFFGGDRIAFSHAGPAVAGGSTESCP